MRWHVDIEKEVSAIMTMEVEADSREEAIAKAFERAANAHFPLTDKNLSYHLMHVDIA